MFGHQNPASGSGTGVGSALTKMLVQIQIRMEINAYPKHSFQHIFGLSSVRYLLKDGRLTASILDSCFQNFNLNPLFYFLLWSESYMSKYEKGVYSSFWFLVLNPQPILPFLTQWTELIRHFLQIYIERSVSDPDLLIPDPDPAFCAEKMCLIFFWSKIAIYLSLGLHKGRPSYRRNLQS